MAELIYSAIASLDGYVEDQRGSFEWAAPDAEVHAFINDLERPIGTYLYGRRMYETMVYWETLSLHGDQSAAARDFAQISSGRQDRVLADARYVVERADADRARFRSCSDQSAQAVLGARHHDRRYRTGWPGDVRRPDRRMSFVPLPDCRRGGTRAFPMTFASSSSCWTNTASAAESFTFAMG